MRYGFWSPVFGGWLRNIPDALLVVFWVFFLCLCLCVVLVGYDLTLVAELNLNDF